MIASATEHGSLAERVDSFFASDHSNLHEAHLISATGFALDSVFLHLLGVSGHVNPFIAGHVSLENLV